MVLPAFVSVVVEIIGGVVLLFYGKKLFYLFVGIAGFTLGGRFGWLHRKIGLGCDSLKSATRHCGCPVGHSQ